MALELFNLVKDKMLVYVVLRIEKHGEDNVNAYDVKLSGDFSNSILLKLHPELRDTFYVADRQGDIEGFKKALRFPRIDNAINWSQEIPRTLLTLHDIHDEGEDLVLGNGHTDKMAFDMLEGGTVKFACRVKLCEPSEEQIAKLLRANGQTLPVSLECAPLEEKADNFEQVEQLSLTGTAPSAARLELESLFDKAPTDMAIANGMDTPDDVVDAEFIEPAEEVETEAVTIVLPAKKRGSRKAGAAEIE